MLAALHARRLHQHRHGHDQAYEQAAQEKATREHWLFERKQGNNRLLRMLLQGDWADDEFLVVPPHHRIEQSGDDGLIRAVPVG